MLVSTVDDAYVIWVGFEFGFGLGVRDREDL